MEDQFSGRSRPFYVNIIVLNKEQILNRKAYDAVKDTAKATHKLVGKLANALVSDEMIAAEIAKQLEQQVPETLQEKGITAVVDTKHVAGSLIVQSIDVRSVDAQVMASQGASPIVGVGGLLAGGINEAARSITRAGMEVLLPEILQAALAAKGVRCEVTSRLSKEEEPFLSEDQHPGEEECMLRQKGPGGTMAFFQGIFSSSSSGSAACGGGRSTAWGSASCDDR